jgi:hypothetical protein
MFSLLLTRIFSNNLKNNSVCRIDVFPAVACCMCFVPGRLLNYSSHHPYRFDYIFYSSFCFGNMWLRHLITIHGYTGASILRTPFFPYIHVSVHALTHNWNYSVLVGITFLIKNSLVCFWFCLPEFAAISTFYFFQNKRRVRTGQCMFRYFMFNRMLQNSNEIDTFDVILFVEFVSCAQTAGESA